MIPHSTPKFWSQNRTQNREPSAWLIGRCAPLADGPSASCSADRKPRSKAMCTGRLTCTVSVFFLKHCDPVFAILQVVGATARLCFCMQTETVSVASVAMKRSLVYRPARPARRCAFLFFAILHVVGATAILCFVCGCRPRPAHLRDGVADAVLGGRRVRLQVVAVHVRLGCQMQGGFSFVMGF